MTPTQTEGLSDGDIEKLRSLPSYSTPPGVSPSRYHEEYDRLLDAKMADVWPDAEHTRKPKSVKPRINRNEAGDILLATIDRIQSQAEEREREGATVVLPGTVTVGVDMHQWRDVQADEWITDKTFPVGPCRITVESLAANPTTRKDAETQCCMVEHPETDWTGRRCVGCPDKSNKLPCARCETVGPCSCEPATLKDGGE